MILPVSHSTCRHLLAVDTSGGCLSVALLEGDDVVAEASSERRAGAALHELMREILARGGLRAPDLGRLGVARGPGSFTGLRVGLAAVAGLSLAAGIPAVGIETTRAVALASGATGRVAVVLEGGQGRLFAGLHQASSRAVATVEGPLDLSMDEACRLACSADRAILRGHPPGESRLLEAGCVAFDGPIAAAVGRLARASEPDPGTIEALYARLPAIRPPG